ncbi:hypothetical protein HRI_002553700 [Hibiscus trionum]|uniref:Uncharacterized protein n=1 Tax=Hibiscus trionum TaxID=183268 RepID=A0A9W7I1Z7_HIBTR|nr:hypothetical protein HRI_002553700 [Hibiscus trionum]
MPRRKLSDLRIVQVPREEEVSNNEGVSGVGSSQVPETVEETQVEVGQRRKSRGRTMLTGLYNLPPGERVQVSRNDAGQPIGAEAGVLANVIGMTARNGSLLPISYESWREMPNGNKNQAVDHIKERFSLEVSDDYVKHANESVLALLVDRNRSILTLPGRRALPVLLMRRNLSPEVVLDEYNSSTSRTQRKMALLLLLKLQKLWPK